jgi:hypothetical protein
MKKHAYRCYHKECKFSSDSKPQFASHIRWQHINKAVKKAKPKKVTAKRKLRQEMRQHIPRPENFSISGCGIEIYYDHLTYIPDFETDTIEYLDKERVCKKCRKRYNLDKLLTNSVRSKEK